MSQFKPIKARGSGGHPSALMRAACFYFASSKCLFIKVQATSSLHLRRLSSLASSADMEWECWGRGGGCKKKISLAGPKVGQTVCT